MKIAFDRDRYGTDARSSLVADFVEACAWKYGRYQLDDMEALLRALGRTRARDVYVFGPEDDDQDERGDDDQQGVSAADMLGEASDDGQRNVISLLRERQTVLDEQYPFHVDDVAVTWKNGVDSAYDSLLAITLAHAFSVAPSSTIAATTVEVLFEQVAARCMESAVFRVHNLGYGGRKASSFPAALEQASEALDWHFNATAVPHKRTAQEEGCDTIVMLPWRDKRPGRLFMIGQATLAASGSWHDKIREPSPGSWGPRLQPYGNPPPVPFLAVAHHVERGNLISLQAHASGMVIDRLRLACGRNAGALSQDERQVIASVRAAEIEV
jgi:hypothetical protein